MIITVATATRIQYPTMVDGKERKDNKYKLLPIIIHFMLVNRFYRRCGIVAV